MTIIEDIPLAKHFIKKGKKISAEDLCYLNSSTGEITHLGSSIGSAIGSSIAMISFSDIVKSSKLNINNEASKIVGQCTTEDIVEYQPIDIKKLESSLKKMLREDKQKAQAKKRIRKLKTEALKKSMNQKLQQNLAGEDFKESNIINVEIEDSLTNEIKNNIWL